jgi:hypothetical protein
MDRKNTDKENNKSENRLWLGLKFGRAWSANSGHEVKIEDENLNKTEESSKKDSGNTK